MPQPPQEPMPQPPQEPMPQQRDALEGKRLRGLGARDGSQEQGGPPTDETEHGAELIDRA
jgi:hypothetical protein